MGAHSRAGDVASVNPQRREYWLQRLARGETADLLAEVRRLITEIAGGPFGPLQVTSYRFPDGRHEFHVEVGPDRGARLAGVGRNPLDAAAGLLVVVEQEMDARRLERWRARSPR